MDTGIDPEAKPPDYLFLLRPMILIPVWTFFLLGAYHARIHAQEQVPLPRLLLGAASFTLLIGAVYIVNQITDRESDLDNEKLFLIPRGIIPVRAAWLEACLLTAAALAAGAFVSLSFFLVLLPSAALGAAYSLEPVRLKRRPFLDTAANAAGNGILNTLAGWIAAGAPPAGLHVLLPYPLAVAAVHLVTTLADIEGDRRAGMRTTGMVAGERRGLAAATALMAAAALCAWSVGNGPALIASLLSLPFFPLPALASRPGGAPGKVLLPAKTATLAFTITVGFLFPFYLPFVAAVVLMTRIYYRRRFRMAYPSL